MKKYRIKKISKSNGTVKIYAQVYKGFFLGWYNIIFDGTTTMFSDIGSFDREEYAKDAIRQHHLSGGKKKKVEYTTITKLDIML